MAQPPPDGFGSALRSEWLLDPAVTYLNHGTVGAPPRKVLEYQWALTQLIERQPAQFMLRELADGHATGQRSRMREAAAEVARFVGADADGFVFVDNITEGANAVLKSYPLAPGDQVFTTDLGYGGVIKTAEYSARLAGAEFHTIAMPRPGAKPDEFVGAVADALAANPGDGTRLLVVDHLTSATALVLPLADIAAAAHAAGALVLADGAHVPGQIALDIAALGVDWYTANLHKWAWAPRSAGFLWAAPEQRPHLRPTVTSWGLDLGMAAEFDLPGTHNPTAFLTAPYSIELIASYGLDAVWGYTHDLAWWAGQFLADSWDTGFTTPEEMIGAMATVALPSALGGREADAVRVFQALSAVGIEAPIYPVGTHLETRISAPIYCDRADVERLAAAVKQLAG
ncbi:MAG TPA: aminotransferase class V-fold PLP-dependent enzyme [Ilumatobacter sp.]|nr:aminotransferase class V-fold PLP-dependent enzyme [Ilumatobacter sp.]